MAEKIDNLDLLAAKTTKVEEKGRGLGDRAKAAFLVAIAVGAVAMGVGNMYSNSFDPMAAQANLSNCQNAIVFQQNKTACMAEDVLAQLQQHFEGINENHMSQHEFGASLNHRVSFFGIKESAALRDQLRSDLIEVAEQAMDGKSDVDSYKAAAEALTVKVQDIYNQTMSLENAEKVFASNIDYAYKNSLSDLEQHAYGSSDGPASLDIYTKLAYDHMMGDDGFGDHFIDAHGGINGAAKELQSNSADPAEVIESIKASNAYEYNWVKSIGSPSELLNNIRQSQQEFSASPDGMRATFKYEYSGISKQVTLHNKDSHRTLEGTENSSKLNNLFSDKVQTGAEKAAKDYANKMEAQKDRVFTSAMG